MDPPLVPLAPSYASTPDRAGPRMRSSAKHIHTFLLRFYAGPRREHLHGPGSFSPPKRRIISFANPRPPLSAMRKSVLKWIDKALQSGAKVGIEDTPHNPEKAVITGDAKSLDGASGGDRRD